MRFLIIPLLAVLLVPFAAAESNAQKNLAGIVAGGVIPRVVTGAGWTTEIQVINTNSINAPMVYRIEFKDSAGNPMSVRIQGPFSEEITTQVLGIVDADGMDLYRLPESETLKAGYAVVTPDSTGAVMATSVLTQRVEGRPDFQASVPNLAGDQKQFRMSFRNGGVFTTALAITSSGAQNWYLQAYSPTGALLCSAETAMANGQHTAFLLDQILPCTTGVNGLLQIDADGAGGAPIGFIFNDFGAFTTQTPFSVFAPIS